MAELINLRTARKRAQRRQDEARAEANRLTHAQPKHLRKLKPHNRQKPTAISTSTGSNRGNDR